MIVVHENESVELTAPLGEGAGKILVELSTDFVGVDRLGGVAGVQLSRSKPESVGGHVPMSSGRADVQEIRVA